MPMPDRDRVGSAQPGPCLLQQPGLALHVLVRRQQHQGRAQRREHQAGKRQRPFTARRRVHVDQAAHRAKSATGTASRAATNTSRARLSAVALCATRSTARSKAYGKRKTMGTDKTVTQAMRTATRRTASGWPTRAPAKRVSMKVVMLAPRM